MNKREKAIELFLEGYNCAQAVFAAFSEDFGLDRETALKLSSTFGAGMGGLKEVCGALSGAFMALGLSEGYTSPDAKEEKAATYKKVSSLAEEFKAKHGSLLCRELVSKVSSPTYKLPEEFKKRPCAVLVGDAAEILENHLKNK